MLVNEADSLESKATDDAGNKRSLFRPNENGGRSRVLRMHRGSSQKATPLFE